MINNRQNGRRRGRGGGPRSPNNAPSPGNRQDNRQRGNAAQLLEKYKSLARDAQLAGDRVQTEYYLQFADHYFRVLNENRSRFDEQPRRQRDDFSDDEEDLDEGLEASGQDEREERYDRPVADQRNGAESRNVEPRQSEGREGRNGEGRNGESRSGEGRQHRPRPRLEARRDEEQDSEGEEQSERISLEVLPPAIVADNGEEGPRAPRRRTRRPRTDGNEDIAPAA